MNVSFPEFTQFAELEVLDARTSTLPDCLPANYASLTKLRELYVSIRNSCYFEEETIPGSHTFFPFRRTLYPLCNIADNYFESFVAPLESMFAAELLEQVSFPANSTPQLVVYWAQFPSTEINVDVQYDSQQAVRNALVTHAELFVFSLCSFRCRSLFEGNLSRLIVPVEWSALQLESLFVERAYLQKFSNTSSPTAVSGPLRIQ